MLKYYFIIKLKKKSNIKCVYIFCRNEVTTQDQVNKTKNATNQNKNCKKNEKKNPGNFEKEKDFRY